MKAFVTGPRRRLRRGRARARTIAEARRIGGGGAAGMQRSVPPRAAARRRARQARRTGRAARRRRPPPAPPPRPRRKRSWMGPIAGLAAGLGIAALMSHLGLGAEFGNIMMMVLLGVVAFVAGPLPDAPLHAAKPAAAQPAGPAVRRRRRAARSAPAPPTSSPAQPAPRRRHAAAQLPAAAPPLRRRRRGQPAGRLRCRRLRAHRQDDLHPHAGGERQPAT